MSTLKEPIIQNKEGIQHCYRGFGCYDTQVTLYNSYGFGISINVSKQSFPS